MSKGGGSYRLVRLMRKGSAMEPFPLKKHNMKKIIGFFENRGHRMIMLIFFMGAGMVINYFKYNYFLPTQLNELVDILTKCSV